MAEYKFCSTKDMAIEILEFIKSGYKKYSDRSGVKKYVDALQMGIDAIVTNTEEVMHGEWQEGHYQGGMFDGTNFEKCSVCQFERYFDDITFKTAYNFCPNCGADMRGEEPWPSIKL